MAHFTPVKETATVANNVEPLAGCLTRYYTYPEVLIVDKNPLFHYLL